MCLSVQSGGGFEAREAPRRSPGVDEIEIAVEAASVNPIDVRRADGYGRRRLSLLAASRFPMTLGNGFAGTVVAAGKGCEGVPAVGDRVYGVKPISRDGSHASHLLPNGRLRAESAAGPKHSGPRGAAVFLRDDLARREGSRVNSRQLGEDCPRAWGGAVKAIKQKKGGCGRVCGGGAALHVGFVQAGSGKHLLKWLGSSSYDGSISRLGLRRRPRHPCRL